VGHTSSTILNSCSFQRYRMSFRNLYSILLKQTLPSKFSDITSRLGLKKYPKLTFQELESAYWFLSYGKVIFHCQLMCTVPSQVDWAWKTTPNSPLKHQNLPIGSWVIVRLSSIVSGCVQCHHKCTGLKKLPQIDPWSIRICLLVPELW